MISTRNWMVGVVVLICVSLGSCSLYLRIAVVNRTARAVAVRNEERGPSVMLGAQQEGRFGYARLVIRDGACSYRYELPAMNFYAHPEWLSSPSTRPTVRVEYGEDHLLHLVAPGADRENRLRTAPERTLPGFPVSPVSKSCDEA